MNSGRDVNARNTQSGRNDQFSFTILSTIVFNFNDFIFFLIYKSLLFLSYYVFFRAILFAKSSNALESRVKSYVAPGRENKLGIYSRNIILEPEKYRGQAWTSVIFIFLAQIGRSRRPLLEASVNDPISPAEENNQNRAFR